MEIRRLTKADTKIAEEILKNFNPESSHDIAPSSFYHLESFLRNDNCYVIAALENNAPLAFVLAYSFPSFYANQITAYLYDIEVLPGYRKKGIAKQMIRALVQTLKENGVNEVWLGTGLNNIPAQKLFSGTGAEKEEETFYEYFYYLN